MSSTDGSSCAAFFWATSRICLSSFITASSARTDFSRPTNSGTIMCGKTTMSRSGRTAADRTPAHRHPANGGAAHGTFCFGAARRRGDLVRGFGSGFFDSSLNDLLKDSRRQIRPDYGTDRIARSLVTDLSAGMARNSRDIVTPSNLSQDLDSFMTGRRTTANPRIRRCFPPAPCRTGYSGIGARFGDLAVDHHLLHPVEAGQVEHGGQQNAAP